MSYTIVVMFTINNVFKLIHWHVDWQSLDSVNVDASFATLWTIGFSSDSTDEKRFAVQPYKSGTLKEVNDEVRKLGSILSKLLGTNRIKGCISISSDPSGVNNEVFKALAMNQIPVTGSGGTSLSSASAIDGLKLVGNVGGSVATTTYTRAVSYCYALATEWEMDYHPCRKSRNEFLGVQKEKPGLRSIFESCLPIFLVNCVSCEIFGQYGVVPHELMSQMRYQLLPTVCAIVTATSLAPEHNSTAIMAATIASVGCHGSVVSGLFAGWLISRCLSRVLFTCIKMKIPATMTNIILGGVVGLVITLGFTVMKVTWFLSYLSESILKIVQISGVVQQYYFKGLGFLFGCVFVYGSKVGWYHTIFLPIILLEMEHGYPSIWGSIDECTLVLVSAGICAATVIVQNEQLPKRGFVINLSCGDFIEVAYKYMQQSHIVNMFAYIAGGTSTEILYSKHPINVLSSAYLPFPVSIWLAKDKTRIALAMFCAFAISFTGVMCSYLFSHLSFPIANTRTKKNK